MNDNIRDCGDTYHPLFCKCHLSATPLGKNEKPKSNEEVALEIVSKFMLDFDIEVRTKDALMPKPKLTDRIVEALSAKDAQIYHLERTIGSLEKKISKLTALSEENKKLQSLCSAYEEALRPLSGTKDFIEQNIDEICLGAKEALKLKEGR